jgi:hypothetical protein
LRFENSGDYDLLSGFEEDPLAVLVGSAYGFAQFDEVRYFVRRRYLRATDGMLSPRLAR